MAHWVGHSLLKELDDNDYFERKRIIEYLEANLTRSPMYALNTDNLEVTAEANDNESITEVAKASNAMEIYT